MGSSILAAHKASQEGTRGSERGLSQEQSNVSRLSHPPSGSASLISRSHGDSNREKGVESATGPCKSLANPEQQHLQETCRPDASEGRRGIKRQERQGDVTGETGSVSSLRRKVIPLATDEDENWLSEFLCFIRSELVEVFRATQEDVASRINSKKVVFGQVGIRCRYCAHLPHSERASRSSCFPSSISRIYQSLTMVIREHFTGCPSIPDHLKKRFKELRGTTAQGATDSKRYWNDSAVRLGMVDTPNGIIMEEVTAESFEKPASSLQRHGSFSTGEYDGNTSADSVMLLVDEHDKEIVTEYLFFILTQVQRVRLTESERVGNRKSMELDTPGFGCRYCCAAGRKGLCRFFPARRRTLPAKIKDLHDHLRRCKLCPDNVKRRLIELHELEPPKDVSSEERERTFFDRLWGRLHSTYMP
mmetsp:Transcript_16746/g.38502  ORF Transcript_16746/g.38502 Transcript_16746/m.38502 type:complete len:419 (-) Transcript_16746:910-2166(-)